MVKANRNFVRIFIYLYIFAFALLALFSHNNEFLYYSFVYLILLFAVFLFQRKYQFNLQLPKTLLLGFAIFGLAHFAGALLIFHGNKLYDLNIGPVHYDNLVHSLGSFLVTIASFNLIYPYLHPKVISRRVYLLLILVLISLGIGSLNENIEFSAVMLIKDTGVGDYYNNAWDLVYNLVGALIGCFIVSFFILKKKVKAD